MDNISRDTGKSGDFNTAAFKRPFSRSYWVVPCWLLAGYYPGGRKITEMDKKLNALLDCGMRTFLNLMETDEVDHAGLKFTPYDKRVKDLAGILEQKAYTYRHPVTDLGVPSHEEMKQILDRIGESICNNLPVYVHCWGGRGRTGTVIGCWCARHGLEHGRDILEMIKKMRKQDEKGNLPSPETEQQISMVTAWMKGE
jgi:protein tyrosine phosphatase